LIEPVVLARLIQAAGVLPTDVVLVIGCSTGYAGVVLSRLAATVILVEPEARAQALEGLLDELGVDNVAVVVSDDPGVGHPGQAPFDVIFLVGSVASVPPALFEQIGETGRIVAVIDDGRIGKATLFAKLHGVVGQREMFDAQIPPCPGLVSSPGFAF
jgi:protein-L-isoaspartate(D-aspartate) O-methyltransferase